MTGLYLKETAKLFDIVDLTICCSLYKICNGNQFEHMYGFRRFHEPERSFTACCCPSS